MSLIRCKGTGDVLSDYTCGCVAWKRHSSRAIFFHTVDEAFAVIEDLELEYVGIVKYSEEG